MCFRSLAAGLLLSVCAAAAEPAAPELRIEAVDAGSVIFVKNVADRPLTAFLVELVNYPGSNWWMLDDSWVDGLAPGQEKRMPVSNMTIGASPEYCKITAAVFADGTSAGAPAKVALIVDRRRGYLEAVRDMIGRITAAQAAGKDKTALIAELRALPGAQRVRARTADGAVRPSGAQNAIDTAIERLASGSYGEALENLRGREKGLAASKPPL